MYPPDIDVLIARICIAVSVVGSFTTLHFSGFYCWQDLLLTKVHGKKCKGFTFKQACVERVCFIGFCTGVALVVKQLGLVLDLTGAVAIMPMMFCFPGMLQLKLNEIVNNGDSFPFYNLKSRFWGYFLIVSVASTESSAYPHTSIRSIESSAYPHTNIRSVEPNAYHP
jgi:hypothetical protein